MSVESNLPDYVARNRLAWDRWADNYAAGGERSWLAREPRWGIWGVPESRLRLLDGIENADAIELGCGTAYVSAWMARRGARPVGIDNSPRQLETARRLQKEHSLDFPLLLGNAESLPYPDASFDFAISEYGVAIWADPYKWIPEASRVLRPNGRLVFIRNGYLLILCSPDSDQPAAEQLLRPQFGPHRVDWESDGSTEFHLPHGELIRLLRDCGFELEELVEIQAPPDGSTRYDYVTTDWARKWPSEEVWKARKRG